MPCNKCGKTGHNKRTCKDSNTHNLIVEKEIMYAELDMDSNVVNVIIESKENVDICGNAKHAKIVEMARSVLMPYTRNCNTGNQYEIHVILQFLRKMGMTDEDMLNIRPVFSDIVLKNDKISDKLEYIWKNTLKTQVCGELLYDGHTIVGMKNITQSDNVGKTGDIILITDKGIELSISITEGNAIKKTGDIHKCLTNPTAKRLGATNEDIEICKKIADEGVLEYKRNQTEKYGTDESKWPERQKSTIAITVATQVASQTADRFNSLTLDHRQAIFLDLLRIDDLSKTPADFLALVEKNFRIVKHFKFISPLIHICSPEITARGVFLILKNKGIEVGRIQVKFNNGIYHKGKTSSIVSSWNFVAYLNKIFQIEQVN
jgi:hypothetical protein